MDIIVTFFQSLVLKVSFSVSLCFFIVKNKRNFHRPVLFFVTASAEKEQVESKKN